MTHRFIVLWWKPDAVLDWNFYVAEDLQSAERVVASVIEQGAIQYRTYKLGEQLPDLSGKF